MMVAGAGVFGADRKAREQKEKEEGGEKIVDGPCGQVALDAALPYGGDVGES
jgi:hypothetical protein